jgi:hypothetical protein
MFGVERNIRIPHIYGLPKLHKSPLALRPIVPAARCLTTGLSVTLHYYLHDHATSQMRSLPYRQRSICSSSRDCLVALLSLNDNPMLDDCVLVTYDVSSLYTNLDNDACIQLVSQFLRERNADHGIISFVEVALRFVLDNNVFMYGKRALRQLSGAAMGSNCIPTVSNICLYMLERSLFTSYPHDLLLHKRFLDDGLAVLRRSFVVKFQEHFHFASMPRIRYEFGAPGKTANFLDFAVLLHARRFHTRLYMKPANLYQCLPPSSAHPPSTFRSIIRAQALRLAVLCSTEDVFLEAIRTYCSQLRLRGYSPSLIMHTILRVSYSSVRSRMNSDIHDAVHGISSQPAGPIVRTGESNPNNSFDIWVRLLYCPRLPAASKWLLAHIMSVRGHLPNELHDASFRIAHNIQPNMFRLLH